MNNTGTFHVLIGQILDKIFFVISFLLFWGNERRKNPDILHHNNYSFTNYFQQRGLGGKKSQKVGNLVCEQPLIGIDIQYFREYFPP